MPLNAPTFINDYTGDQISGFVNFDANTALSVRVQASGSNQIRFAVNAAVTSSSPFWPQLYPQDGLPGTGTNMLGYVQSDGSGNAYGQTTVWHVCEVDPGDNTTLGPQTTLTTNYTSGSLGSGLEFGGLPGTDAEFFGDILSSPMQVGLPIPDVPFSADPTPYVYRVTYWQRLEYFAPKPLTDAGPYGGYHVGEVQGSFRDVVAGEVIEFQREFALLPPSRNEYETFVYSQQWVGTINGLWVQLGEVPLTMKSRVQYDYFFTPDINSIILFQAPRVVSIPYGSGQQIIALNGWQYVRYGQEILAEDVVAAVWKGHIYERKQRSVIFMGGLQ